VGPTCCNSALLQRYAAATQRGFNAKQPAVSSFASTLPCLGAICCMLLACYGHELHTELLHAMCSALLCCASDLLACVLFAGSACLAAAAGCGAAAAAFMCCCHCSPCCTKLPHLLLVCPVTRAVIPPPFVLRQEEKS
jgi:hypothetical protein